MHLPCSRIDQALLNYDEKKKNWLLQKLGSPVPPNGKQKNNHKSETTSFFDGLVYIYINIESWTCGVAYLLL